MQGRRHVHSTQYRDAALRCIVRHNEAGVGHDHVRAIFADSNVCHTRSWNFSKSLLGSL